MIDIKKISGIGLVEGYIETIENTIEKDIIEKGYCQLNFDIKTGQQIEKYLKHFYGGVFGISTSFLDANYSFEGKRVFYQLHITIK